MAILLTSKMKPSGDFPLLDAEDILMPDGKRLTEYEFSGGGGGGGGGGSYEFSITLKNTLPSRVIVVSENSPVILKFNYSSVNEDGYDDGDGIGTILVGGVRKASFSVKQGDNEIPVTQYLSSGSNTVKITTENSEGLSKSLTYSATIAAMTLTSRFDASIPFNGPFKFIYTPTGIGSKTVHILLDGEEIETTVVTHSGRQQTCSIGAQSHGEHIIECYFEATVEEQRITSNRLKYSVMCLEDGNTTPIISVVFDQDKVEQYNNVAIKGIVYTPNSLTSQVMFSANGNEVSNLTVDRTEQTWTYHPNAVGPLTLKLTTGDVSKSFDLVVTKSDVQIEAETNDLALYLSSNGRSNLESNPGSWSYNDISAEFTGFNFVSDGWVLDENNETVMRVSGDARLHIPYMAFANDFRTTGKTLEFELSTREVLNYDTEVINCYSGDRGFTITAQQLRLASEQSQLGTRYKEDEHIRVTFVAEKKSENRFLLCYINSILTGVVQYPADDDFSQVTPVGITIGSNYCTTDLYDIRIYDNDLTRYQVLNNWIADTRDGAEKLRRSLRNDIYDDYGQIVISKLPNDLCYMILEGTELPQFKDDIKLCSGSFVDRTNPSRSFTFKNAEIDVQGTSSQYYYVKNYKLNFDNGFILNNGSTVTVYRMNDNAVPVAIFTMKADVASSEGAFNVVLSMLYNKYCPFKTPAQLSDPKVRQTIEGFPMVMFWDNGVETKFLGKYNFNNDKETPEVFGFQEGDESWEILQNGTERVGWHSADFSGTGWQGDFKARYPKKNTNITRLKALAEWLVSTDTDQATGLAIVPTTYDGVEYTRDTVEYRLAKYSAELSNYFVEEAIIFYYMYTELFLSIDQREKNAFPTYIKSLDRWVVLFYDADSSIGTDNKGNLAFDYWLEDIDYTEAGDPIYNGQNSVLWKNLRATRYNEIMAMYQNLRTSGGLNYESVISAFEEHQSKWPEAIFNEDMYRKCLEPLILEGDGTYLPMLQGKKEQWMKWWLYNRFRYMDSKYVTGTSMTNRITIRAHQKANIFLTSYANIVGHVYYNDTMVEHRMTRGVEYEFEWPASGAEDPVIGINDADLLTSLGDLSPLMVELIDVSGAPHITVLKIGDEAEDYVNYNLNSVTLGNNKLLRLLDLRKCVNLSQSINASGCTNIEEVYMDGTSITGISLPNGGILKKLHLPGTVTNLSLCNQKALTEFVIDSCSKITTLRLENNNSDVIDPLAIFAQIPANSRVRIIGFDLTVESLEDILDLYDRFDSMRGLDENGNNLDKAVVSGVIHIDSLTSDELVELNTRYPNITIDYNLINVYIRFYNGEELISETLYAEGAEIIVPADPTKESTAQYHHPFIGWSTDGEHVVEINIAGKTNMTYHAMFNNVLRYYTIRFLSESVELQSSSMAYGAMPAYVGDDPVKEGEWAFKGWSPEIGVVTGDVDYVAQFRSTAIVSRKLVERTLSGDYVNDRVTSIGAMAVYKCTNLTSVDLPLVTSIGNQAFASTRLTTLILRSETMCTLESMNVFSSTPISSGTGYIYVPAALVESYKTAPNWSKYANQFRAIEDYPEICGGGE